MMTALFTVLMLAGFIGVYAVDYEWQNNYPNEELFITDGDASFVVVEHGIGYPDPYYYDLQTSQRVFKDSVPMQYNRTAIWDGNTTYSMAVNETDGASNSAIFVIDMPNVQNWVISEVWVNMSKNADPDLTLQIAIYSFDSVHDYTDPVNNIFTSYSVGGVAGLEYSTGISVPLATALTVNNDANEHTDNVMVISLQDKDHDGLSAFAWDMEITIKGQKTSEMSISDTVAWVIGGSCVLNIVAILYMTDGIDIIKSADASKYRKTKMSAALPFISLGGFGSAGAFGIELADLSFDVIYFLPVFMMVFAFIMAYYKRVTIPTAVISVIVAVAISVMFAPYQAIVLQPMINAIWYGYSWLTPSYLPILAAIHVTSLFLMAGVALYNLVKTHGKALWL